MDWTKLLENSLGPLLGSFAGASAALSSIWIKESLDRRRSVQEWFENEYVLGATNTLIELLHRWTHMILHYDSQSSLRVDFSTLPHLAMTRLSSVLRSPSLDRMFYVLSDVVYKIGAQVHVDDRSLIDWPHIAREVSFLRDALMDLQLQLLELRIGRKADISKLHLRTGIAAIRCRIEEHVKLWEADKMFRLRTGNSVAQDAGAPD